MMQMVTIRSVTLAGDPQPGVDGRELHGALAVRRDFTTWMKDRIEIGQFEDGQDFSPILGKTSNGRPKTEYLLSLDMAKHLAMLERSAAGKACRAYFIAAEKRLRHIEAEAPANDDDDFDTRGPTAMRDYAAPLGLVRECRVLFGVRMAQRLWKHIGLPMPDEDVAAGGIAYRGDVDPGICDWAQDRLEAAPGARVAASILYDDYTRWCVNRSVSARSIVSFGKQIGKLGIGGMYSNVAFRLGVRLKSQ